MTQQSNVPTALVVETNYLLASGIEAPLSATGYRVLIATDPGEAFDMLEAEAVSVALIDFRLQHLKPDGLVYALRRRGIPFIFCTAASTEEVNEHFPNARVMLKPFSDAELMAAVSEICASLPEARSVVPPG